MRLVIHSNRSCKPYSAGEYDIQRLVSEKTGLLSMIIEANMSDARCRSDARMQTPIEAFMETLPNKELSIRLAKVP